jgi:hypothetical protein
LLPHPLTEGHQESWVANGLLDTGEADDPRLVQVAEEHVGAMEHVQSVRMAVAWAPASRQVTTEALKRLPGQRANGRAVALRPTDEVLRRSEVSAGRDLGKARFGQGVRKSLKQRTGGTISQGVNPGR